MKTHQHECEHQNLGRRNRMNVMYLRTVLNLYSIFTFVKWDKGREYNGRNVLL